MIEIYTGDGKGKSTAAAGLALRAAGRGVPVVYVQFLKDGSSGEMQILHALPRVHQVLPAVFHGFVFQMSEEEKKETAADCGRMLEESFQMVQDLLQERNPVPENESSSAGELLFAEIRVLWVLDEVLDALRLGLLSEAELCRMLDVLPEGAEVVLTGRDPADAIRDRADYITGFRNLRHPYEKGIKARVGVEL